MSKFIVKYTRRNITKSIDHIEIIEAASIEDAMWEAFSYARCLGLDAEVTEA